MKRTARQVDAVKWPKTQPQISVKCKFTLLHVSLMTIAMLKRLLFKFTFIKSIRFQEFGGLKQKVASLVFIRHTRRSSRRHELTSCYFSTPSPGKNLCTHSWFSSIKNFVIASYHESNTLRFLSHPKTDCS